jgi:hypothetical protein
MPTPAQSDPDGCWPSCDDEQPGVSIRPLSQADLAALLAHLDQHDHDQDLDDPLEEAGPAPVVAVRVRASVGRPGASAHAEYRRRRAVERAAWTRTLPWRTAAVLAGGLGVGLVAAQLVPRLAGLAWLLAGACLAWALRFRVSVDTLAWRRGAAGERRTARLLAPLERQGWAVLHDLAIPGSAANIDHVVIGPGGVAVIDTKQYRGRLWLDSYGLLWHGRHLLSMTPAQGAVGGRPGRRGPRGGRRPGRGRHRGPRRQRPLGSPAGRWRHRCPRPSGARPAPGAAADPRA